MKHALHTFGLLAIWTPIIHYLIPAISRDITRGIAGKFWFIVIWDRTIGLLSRRHTWRGEWQVVWHTDSDNFATANDEVGRLFRCFSSVAIEGSGHTPSGSQRYRFVGNVTNEQFVTGTWYDRDDQPGGYHGAFQVRLAPNVPEASGKWIGFSKTKPEVKGGDLILRRISL